jgi:hypothetical protein
MIGTPGGTPGEGEEPGRRHDETPSAEPRPFSHDSHFSISAHDATGYRLHAIDQIIVIGANGHIVTVERPGTPFGERRRKGAMPVPVALSKAHGPLRFLWGSGHSVLGLSGVRPGMLDVARAVQDHLKYEALHHRVLDGVGDIALQAFLRFLERNTASDVSEFPAIAEQPRCKLAFRFQYDEHYLHERHAAQLAWKRFLAQNAAGADQAAPPMTYRG